MTCWGLVCINLLTDVADSSVNFCCLCHQCTFTVLYRCTLESGVTLVGSVTFLVLSWVLKKKWSLCLNSMCNANMQSMPFHIIYLWLLAKMKQVKLFTIRKKTLHVEHEVTSSKWHGCTAWTCKNLWWIKKIGHYVLWLMTNKARRVNMLVPLREYCMWDANWDGGFSVKNENSLQELLKGSLANKIVWPDCPLNYHG